MSRVTSSIQNILGETKHKAVFDHFKTGCCSCCFIRRERCETDMDRIYKGHLNLRHPFSFMGDRKKIKPAVWEENTARATPNPALLSFLR